MGVVKRVVIVGAGASGLAMLEHLLRCRTPMHIRIVDPDPATCGQRTWCQWIDPAERRPYHTHVWPSITFRSPSAQRTHTHPEVAYAYAHGTDYQHHVRNLDTGHHRVEWIERQVRAFDFEVGAGVTVHLDKGQLLADWVFTSWYPRRDLRIPLWQQFHGWIVETRDDRFDPDRISLMDFDLPQIEGKPTFGYVLPFGPRKALVEITGFAPRPWREPVYERAIRDYLEHRFGLAHGAFDITSTETGRIPMGRIPFPGKPNPATFPIGTVAGAVKPTTGYAFSRIQRQCAHLAESLDRTGQPSYPRPTSSRFRYYDDLLLDILRNHPHQAIPIFSGLFGRVEIDTIFRFLDERTTPSEEALLFARLPIRPFLSSAWRHLF